MKGTFNYDNDSLSITESLQNNKIVNFLQRGSQLTYASQRDILQKFLLKKTITPKMVEEYSTQNPLQQQQVQIDTRFGSQKEQ